MNREIKFRAWVMPTGMFAGEPYMAIQGTPDIESLQSFMHHYSDEPLLMQFTGLKDKNGVDIYEGDIGEIKAQSGRIERFVVKWGVHRREMKSGWTVDIPGFCFEVDGFPTFPIVNNYVNGHDLDIITIIGNIHANPGYLNQTQTP